jgi:membrane-associated protein
LEDDAQSMEWLGEFFSHLYRFDELIRWGGYAVLVAIVFAETGLLAGFFLPGDSLLVTAGLLASTEGLLNVWWLILLLSAAAIIGDSTGYAIGYYLGPKIFRREDSRFFHRDHLVRTQRFYEKYGGKTIILARFVPIIRTFAPTVAGAGRMAYRRFLVFNVAGGIGWVASMTLAGYWLGHMIPDIERYLHWVIAVVIAVSFLPILREWRRSHRAKASQEVR